MVFVIKNSSWIYNQRMISWAGRAACLLLSSSFQSPKNFEANVAALGTDLNLAISEGRNCVDIIQ